MTAINRWTAQKRDLEMANNLGKATYMGGALPASAQYGPYAAKKRPKIASEVDSVKECEHWRTEIIRGMAKKIGEIQNASLGEHRIRDLNDEINKDLREKKYWEEQIKKLGGADYKAMAPKDVEVYGAELASHEGYKYFGAAKDLPGVRELFETEVTPEAPRKTRKQLFKYIQPDYYGWRDEEDGMLLLAEQQAEMVATEKVVAQWRAEQASKPATRTKVFEDEPSKPVKAIGSRTEPQLQAASRIPDEVGREVAGRDWKAYVDVPTMDDIEQLIIKKKKEALLKQYTTAEQRNQELESSSLVTPVSVSAPEAAEASVK